MNREETHALYAQGREAWNAWANKMLAKRKTLKKAGVWDVEKWEWETEALADFSNEDVPFAFRDDVSMFAGFVFPGRADFRSATFEGVSVFDEAIFNGDAHFDLVVFSKPGRFSQITFCAQVWFPEARFHCGAWFSQSVFRNDAWFAGLAKFEGPMMFDATKFNGKACFSGRNFIKDVLFSDVVFKNKADFGGVKFDCDVDFRRAAFCGEASFNNTTFCQLARFDAVLSEQLFTLENGKFYRVPYFIQAHFVEAPRLDNIQFLPRFVEPGNFWRSISSSVNADVKVRYQALRRLADQSKDSEREREFWAGELRSNRSLMGRSKSGTHNLWRVISPSWWFNILYEVLSDFGRSFGRPVVFWLLATCAMAWIHLSTHFVHVSNATRSATVDGMVAPASVNNQLVTMADYPASAFAWLMTCVADWFRLAPQAFDLYGLADPSCRPAFAAFYLAVQNVIPLSGTASSPKTLESYGCLYGFHKHAVDSGGSLAMRLSKIPDEIIVPQAIHAGFSAVLIFLFLLALRNRFKIR